MLVCADLRRSRDFYRNVLGLAVRQDNEQYVEFDLGGGASLALHPKSDIIAVRPGSMQLAFAVESVDRFVGECASAHVPVFQDPYDDEESRIAIIGDPDGYPIQIMSAARKRRPVS